MKSLAIMWYVSCNISLFLKSMTQYYISGTTEFICYDAYHLHWYACNPLRSDLIRFVIYTNRGGQDAHAGTCRPLVSGELQSQSIQGVI